MSTTTVSEHVHTLGRKRYTDVQDALLHNWLTGPSIPRAGRGLPDKFCYTHLQIESREKIDNFNV